MPAWGRMVLTICRWDSAWSASITRRRSRAGRGARTSATRKPARAPRWCGATCGGCRCVKGMPICAATVVRGMPASTPIVSRPSMGEELGRALPRAKLHMGITERGLHLLAFRQQLPYPRVGARLPPWASPDGPTPGTAASRSTPTARRPSSCGPPPNSTSRQRGWRVPARTCPREVPQVGGGIRSLQITST